MRVDHRLEDGKIVGIEKAASQRFVPQSSGSGK